MCLTFNIMITMSNTTKEFLARCSNHHFTLEEAKLFVESGADVAWKDKFGQTLLMNASIRYGGADGRPKLVKWLLSYPKVLKSINDQSIYGGTALHTAAQCNNISVIRVLLSYGADPTICDLWDQTAAQSAGTEEVAQLIETSFEVKEWRHHNHLNQYPCYRRAMCTLVTLAKAYVQ